MVAPQCRVVSRASRSAPGVRGLTATPWCPGRASRGPCRRLTSFQHSIARAVWLRHRMLRAPRISRRLPRLALGSALVALARENGVSDTAILVLIPRLLPFLDRYQDGFLDGVHEAVGAVRFCPFVEVCLHLFDGGIGDLVISALVELLRLQFIADYRTGIEGELLGNGAPDPWRCVFRPEISVVEVLPRVDDVFDEGLYSVPVAVAARAGAEAVEVDGFIPVLDSDLLRGVEPQAVLARGALLCAHFHGMRDIRLSTAPKVHPGRYRQVVVDDHVVSAPRPFARVSSDIISAFCRRSRSRSRRLRTATAIRPRRSLRCD